MSKIALSGDASGTGTFTIASPNSNSNFTLTIPQATTTIVGTDATQTLTNKTLTSPTITGAVVSSMASSVITAATAQASTSGTSIDFTGIPSWAKRITVMFSGVSTNGTSIIQVQLGDSGGVETTGYVGGYASNGVSGGILSGIPLTYASMSAVSAISGSLTISLLDASTNTWVCAGSQARLSAGVTQEATTFGGGKSLSATLDRVRITTVSGTNTFDAGTINILYE
jgi:hypothetical protein